MIEHNEQLHCTELNQIELATRLNLSIACPNCTGQCAYVTEHVLVELQALEPQKKAH